MLKKLDSIPNEVSEIIGVENLGFFNNSIYGG